MNNLKKILNLAFLIIGTVIGAGFASGREIFIFFGEDVTAVVPLLCGLGIAALSMLFCFMGYAFEGESFGQINKNALGKFHILTDIFLLLNSLIVLSGMLAGIDVLLDMAFPLSPTYSLVCGLLCAIITVKGLKGLMRGNLFIVPLIIICIIAVCARNVGYVSSPFSFSGFTLQPVILYVSMNMMLSCTVLTSLKCTRKSHIVCGSLIAGGIIGLLMWLIIAAAQSTGSNTAVMPLFDVAKQSGTLFFYAALLAVGASIFTTMLTAMNSLTLWVTDLSGDKSFSAACVLLSGLIVSNLGFENVVAYLYPIIGAFGLVYIAFCVYMLIRKRKSSKFLAASFDKSDNKVHYSRQHT